MLYRNRRRKLSCPVKERYNLSTRARGIRVKCTVIHTGGDAICKRPVNSLGIVGVAADIHEAAVASGRFAIVLARGANAACTQAAVDVLNGYININALYFHVYNSAVDKGGTVIGDHVFY